MIWKALDLFYVNPFYFYILELYSLRYKHAHLSRFTQNAIFNRQTFIDKARYHQSEHGFGKLVLTAFQISLIF